MRRMLILTILAAVCFASAQAETDFEPGRHYVSPIPPPWTRRPLIQIALVLDTGSRMAGLIHQAKTEIWAVANEMIFTTKNGQRPIVQLAVFSDNSPWEYGGYADGRVFIPFTTNYYAIFATLDRQRPTSGGDNDRADAVRVALHRLEWSPYPEDFKAVFVVGDGYFTRSNGSLASACDRAAEAGVVVNTLYCGNYKFGINKHWSEPAYCTGGRYMGIDCVRRLAYDSDPVDRKLLALNEELNETFRFDADRWNELWKQQEDRDRDVTIASKEAALQRIVTKAAKGLLLNQNDALINEDTSAWGLEPEIPPSKIPPIDTEADLIQLLEKESDRRDIQRQILELAVQRRRRLAAEGSDSLTGRPSLGEAVIRILREQVTAKGFQFTPPETYY